MRVRAFAIHLQQMLFCVAMVRRVSPNCVRETPNSSNSSWLNWQASQFAIAVMDAVSSHAFIVSPSALYYAGGQPVAIVVDDTYSYNSARPGRHNIRPQFQQREDAVQKTASSKLLCSSIFDSLPSTSVLLLPSVLEKGMPCNQILLSNQESIPPFLPQQRIGIRLSRSPDRLLPVWGWKAWCSCGRCLRWWHHSSHVFLLTDILSNHAHPTSTAVFCEHP